MQDEATRAWNLHTALYYKGQRDPWRLLRHAIDLQTCFVGVSFYRRAEGERLLTSVAQVLNERRQGSEATRAFTSCGAGESSSSRWRGRGRARIPPCCS